MKNKIDYKNITDWQEIPWEKFIPKVQALQHQIVKATLNNEMRLVYQLQNQLITSFEGRALAIRKVVTNSGAKTPGVDQIRWDTPKLNLKPSKN
jgi:RNA-directed DNA polymerase